MSDFIDALFEFNNKYAGFILVILGLAFFPDPIGLSKWLWRLAFGRLRRQQSQISRIPFDRNLYDGNWKLGETGNAPEMKVVNGSSAGLENVVEVIDPCHKETPGQYSYCYDYDLPVPLSTAKIVEFVRKPVEGALCGFYLRCRMISQKGEEKYGWIYIRTGDSGNKHETPNEWEVFLKPSHTGDWETFTIDIPSIWRNTFETEWNEFNGLCGFRIRGTQTLGKITVFQ
jgi:hypothetical protein